MMMLSDLIEPRPALDVFFEYLHSDAGVEEFSEVTRKKLNIPTEEDWFTIKYLEALIQFGALTDEMRKFKNASLGLALPSVRALKTILREKEIFDPVSISVVKAEFEPQVRATMLSVSRTIARLLEARFGDLSTELFWISLLDPRFTDTKLQTAIEKRGAEERLAEERLVAEMVLTAKAARVSTCHTNTVVDPVPISEDPERRNKMRRAAHWERMYGGGPSAVTETAADTDSVLLEKCKWEFNKYLSDAAVVNKTVEGKLF